jgi:hypothetical protein
MAHQNGNATTVGSGTVDGMLGFLDFLVEKGYATHVAVHPLKAVTRTVFSTMEGETFGDFDVRTFDADEYMDRFQNRVPGKYKQESLVSYRQRLKRTVAAYREYLETGNVSAIRSSRTPRQRQAAKPTATTTKPTVNGNGSGNGHGDAPQHDPARSLIDYPFPLRSGHVAHLRLPMQLEKVDADRLGAFIRTLVFEPQLEIPATTS